MTFQDGALVEGVAEDLKMLFSRPIPVVPLYLLVCSTLVKVAVDSKLFCSAEFLTCNADGEKSNHTKKDVNLWI